MSDEPTTRKNHQSNKVHEGGNQVPDTASSRQSDEFQDDLNPAPLAGVNFGLEGSHPEKDAITADEFKELHDRFPQFRQDELRELPILPPGTRLEQGAKYCNLNQSQPQEFVATSDMVAGEKSLFVPKSEVDYQLWNRLIGVDIPERTGEADGSAT